MGIYILCVCVGGGGAYVGRYCILFLDVRTSVENWVRDLDGRSRPLKVRWVIVSVPHLVIFRFLQCSVTGVAKVAILSDIK